MTVDVHEEKIEEDKAHPITVLVNERQVTFQQRQVTGAEIKQVAIAQGVPIQPDFALFEVKDENRKKPVLDDTEVHLHSGQEFSAVAPDDNS